MARVFIIQRIFPEYRRPFYDLLSTRCELKLLHSINKSGIDQGKAHFSQKLPFIKLFGKDSLLYFRTLAIIRKGKPDVVIHESGLGIVSMPVTLLICKLMRIPFVIWGHGYNHTKGFNPGKSLESKYRLWLMKKSAAYILYGHAAKEKLKAYVKPDHFFVAQNTLDTQFHLALKAKLAQVEYSREKRVLVYLGRLVPDKLPLHLVDILLAMPESTRDQYIIQVIGDGPMKEPLMAKAAEYQLSPQFVFHGKLSDRETIANILYRSDVLLIPGYLGLAINHAFCFDLPVFSYKQEADGPFHSPEVEYVVEGETGFLVSGKSPSALAKCIGDYFSNESLQAHMKKQIQKKTKDLSLEKMMKGFTDCINHVMTHG